MSLTEALRNYGANLALVEGEHSVSAADLDGAASALADRLRVQNCRRILVRSSSPSVYMISLVAAEQSGCEIFLAHAAMPDSAVRALKDAHGIDAVIEQTGDIQPGARQIGTPLGGSRSTDARIYLMTSGTTGEPKVAAHRLDSLVAHIRRTASSASARWLLTYPPSSFAGIQVILTSLLGGGTLIVATANPESLALAAIRHRATHISGTPSFWRAFLLALGDASLPELRQATLGGEPVDQPLLDRLSSHFPQAQIAHIYASTEAGALFTVRDGCEGFPAAWLDSGVGEVKLRICGGILEVASPRRMLGYASQHESPVAADGWIRTGDMVRVDGDRVLFTGRADLRINVGGYKVCAEEVERALLAIEGITDARVIGVPSALTGQALVAEVLCAPGYDVSCVQADATRRLKADLESYKVPRLFRTVEASALAESGKKARVS